MKRKVRGEIPFPLKPSYPSLSEKKREKNAYYTNFTKNNTSNQLTKGNKGKGGRGKWYNHKPRVRGVLSVRGTNTCTRAGRTGSQRCFPVGERRGEK